MMDILLDVLIDAAKDTLLVIPFLLVTYIIMEWIEHKTSDASKQAIRKAGAAGPVVGALLGDDNTLVLVEAGFLDAGKFLCEELLHFSVHNKISQ